MVPVNKRVAASLYYMSDEGAIRKVANAFGIVKALSQLLSDELQKQYPSNWHQNIYKYLEQKKQFKRL